DCKRIGGTVVAQCFDYDQQTTQDSKPWRTAEKAAGAQAIYVGGVTATGVCKGRAQMQGIFDVNTPFGDGDGRVQDSECVKAMGAMSPNVYGTLAAVDPMHGPSAKATIDSYRNADPTPTDHT